MDSRTAAFAACPDTGCDWGSFYLGWKAGVDRANGEIRDEVAKMLKQHGELHWDLAESQRMCVELVKIIVPERMSLKAKMDDCTYDGDQFVADQIHEKLEKIDEILLKAGVTFE